MYLSTPGQRQRGNAAGKLLTILLVIGLLGLGAWLVSKDMLEEDGGSLLGGLPASLGGSTGPEPIEPVSGTPTLQSAAPY
jgi:NitT/TauT family transport system substrate-binding protein